ncbi:MAG: arsenate reductase ArsC [Candidatus Krumholzibacteria bacterium]|nr:arsenate reductase ArsC [Candidatus Krumholzibacteria bacterium]
MKVLFVCTANSCRSQMAEAWARELFPAQWQVQSAGLLTYRITDKTRAVMNEVGLDMAGQKPKTFDRVDLDSFDLIVTLSQEAGRYLPLPGDSDRHRPHPVDDPMSFNGTPEETRADFRRGRDEIRDIVQGLVDHL